MSRPGSSDNDDKAGRYLIVGLAILVLAFVAYIDIGADAEVNNIVYWILGGAILGAENIINILKK